MIIKELNCLSSKLIKDIEKLISACNKFDGVEHEINLDEGFNFNKYMNWLFVIYEGDIAVSVLSIFAPRKEEGEISACTLPSYREKGYFKKLYTRAIEELRKYNIPKKLFICPKESKTGKAVIKKNNGIYKFAEYTMKFNKNEFVRLSKYTSKLIEININELDKISKVASVIYNESLEEARSTMKNAIEAKERIQFKLMFQKNHIGMVAVHFYNNKVSIFSVGILPEYRGFGLGREMMCMVLEYLVKNNYGQIFLEVNSDNNIAFKLYKSLGFEVTTEIDYYEK
ncbi:GNAT family N-acetyltransferase [Clostridium felsineum]|uniref:GNAT family N-acetyltransferase n=1 Tax=Clostridium felsineum TaxID=36839 RepID=UPI00214D6316|nr:GNAT family N-acetyltransferase [Clostridium felsineum]MCR3761816.1 GNAT family N-acetyltransferase [Clostridium felsineum]